MLTINEMSNPKTQDVEHRTQVTGPKQTGLDKAISQDKFDLSATSKQLEALIASLNEEPEVNQARVLYFKAELELGKYQAKSDKIAEKMLNLELA